jgi:hypothetical protein
MELAFLQRGKGHKNESLFFIEKNEVIFKDLDKKVRGVLQQLGFKMEEYRGWSLRRGGAMTLARAGVSDRVIRGMGRWRSWCYRMYLDLQIEEKLLASRQIKKVLSEEMRMETNEGLRERVDAWVLREEWVGRRGE